MSEISTEQKSTVSNLLWDKARLFLRNTVLATSSAIFNQVLAFITLPLLINHVGLTDFGLYALATATTGYFSVVTMSARRAVVKFVSESGVTNEDLTNEFFNSAFSLNLVFGLMIGGILALSGIFAGQLFELNADALPKARLLLFMYAGAAIISQPFTVFGSLLYGFQRFAPVSFLDSLGGILRTATILAIYFLDGSIFWLAGQGILYRFFRIFFLYIVVRRSYSFLKFNPYLSSWARVKNIFQYGGWSTLHTISLIMVFQGSTILIGMILSVSMITYYQIAYRLYNLINTASLYLTSAVLPASSASMAEGDYRFIRRVVHSGTRINLSLLLIVTSAMIIFSEYIILYWMGPQYVEHTVTLARVLLVSWVFNALIVLLTPVYWGQGDIAGLSKVYIVLAVLQLVTTVILMKTFGLIGAVVANFLFYSCVSCIGLVLILKTIKIGVKDYLLKTAAPVYAIVIIYFVIAFTVLKWTGWPGNLPSLVIYFILYSSIGFLLCSVISLRRESVTMLKMIIQELKLVNSKINSSKKES